MRLATIRICRRLYVLFAIALVFGEIKSKSPYKRPVVSFNFPVRSAMIRSGCERFYSKVCRYGGETFAYNLLSIIKQGSVNDAVRDNSVVGNNIGGLDRRGLRSRYC